MKLLQVQNIQIVRIKRCVLTVSDVYSKISESAKVNWPVSRSLENRLEKNEKNQIASNKCDIYTLDIMIDFH